MSNAVSSRETVRQVPGQVLSFRGASPGRATRNPPAAGAETADPSSPDSIGAPRDDSAAARGRHRAGLDRGRRRPALPGGPGRDRQAALGAEPPADGHHGAARGERPVRARAGAAGADADRVHRRGAEGRAGLGRTDRLGAAAAARRAAAADEPRGRGRGARAGRRGLLAARGRGGEGLHDRADRA